MKKYIVIALLFMSGLVVAEQAQLFVFDTPEQEQIFNKLSNELRCLVCQNQTIADSNADLAKDLRTEIFKMIKNGKNEQQIVAFMVQRYGDYVLYRPPVKPMTWLLWFGPILVFIIVVIMVVRFIRGQNSATNEDDLSGADIERLKILQKTNNRDSQEDTNK